MPPPGTDSFSLWMQVGSTALFGLVFLFLWRQSGIVYFGLWSLAWAAQAGALVFARYYLVTRSPLWLVVYAFLEFTFTTLLVAAARAGFSGTIRNWRGALKILLGFPLFLAAAYVLAARTGYPALHVLHAILLGSVYVYNFSSIRGRRMGARLFRFSLLSLAAALFYHALVMIYLHTTGAEPGWMARLQDHPYYTFVFNTVLAFAAMAMWMESQGDSMRELAGQLDSLRRENARSMELDHLTGLLNQSALAKRMEEAACFEGVVAVCDMDDFKEINDRYGHLVGDEILRSVGHLLRASIRPEDEAFRWGGDEFVVLFHSGVPEVVGARMREISGRLRGFRIRSHGVLPISFSWGAAGSGGRSLREVVDEADREMYAFKRSRR